MYISNVTFKFQISAIIQPFWHISTCTKILNTKCIPSIIHLQEGSSFLFTIFVFTLMHIFIIQEVSVSTNL